MTGEEPGSAWRWEKAGGLWTLWFDQPGRPFNILDRPALEELDERLYEVEAAGDLVSGVLFRSAKPSGFSAGADLHAFLDAETPDEVEIFLRRGLDVFDRLERLRTPTTAVLHGTCLGGGLELALACRHRVAYASDVPLQAGAPEVHFGLVPGWGGIDRLPRLLAPRDALDLLLYGNPLGFLQARSQGLVDRLISRRDDGTRLSDVHNRAAHAERPISRDVWDAELTFARAKLEQHSVSHPQSQEAILEIIEADLDSGPDAARELTVRRLADLAMLDEARDAMADFLERPRV